MYLLGNRALGIVHWEEKRGPKSDGILETYLNNSENTLKYGRLNSRLPASPSAGLTAAHEPGSSWSVAQCHALLRLLTPADKPFSFCAVSFFVMDVIGEPTNT
jgi:hypothetical protein